MSKLEDELYDLTPCFKKDWPWLVVTIVGFLSGFMTVMHVILYLTFGYTPFDIWGQS